MRAPKPEKEPTDKDSMLRFAHEGDRLALDVLPPLFWQNPLVCKIPASALAKTDPRLLTRRAHDYFL